MEIRLRLSLNAELVSTERPSELGQPDSTPTICLFRFINAVSLAMKLLVCALIRDPGPVYNMSDSEHRPMQTIVSVIRGIIR
jgi:hypothetical protein